MSRRAETITSVDEPAATLFPVARPRRRALVRLFFNPLACLAGLAAMLPVQAGLVSLTTFEPTPPGQPAWVFPYHYAWGFDPSGCVESADPFFVDPAIPSNSGPTVLRLAFDDAAISQVMTNTPDVGFGAGVIADLFWPNQGWRFVSSNRENYWLDFEARTEGLLPGMTSAPVRLQFALYVPDGTIVPSDPASPDLLLQLDWYVNLNSNWTHYSASLGDLMVTGGSAERFAQYRSNIADLRFDCCFHQPGNFFGYDANNALLVDNIRLQVFCGGPTPPPQTGVPVANWNFDDWPLTNDFGGYCWVPNGPAPRFACPTSLADMAGYGVGGSNGWWLKMDNTALAPPNTPPWAGVGTGGSGAVDFRVFDTGDLAAYRVSFAARVEGLAAWTTRTTCALQVFLKSTNGDLRLDFNVPAESNWLSTACLLKNASAGFGSKASFATNFSTYTALRTEWRIETAISYNDWDFDSNNLLVIDDFKLERLYTACSPLQLAASNGLARITWDTLFPGDRRLQTATSPEGPWLEITNGLSPPVILPLTNSFLFLRTRFVPWDPCDF